MSTEHTPEGFRKMFLKSSFTSKFGQTGGSTLTELLCRGQTQPVYMLETSLGNTFIYNVHFPEDQCKYYLGIPENQELPSDIKSLLEPLSKREIQQVADCFTSCSKPADVRAKIIEKSFRINIITTDQLSDAASLQLLLGFYHHRIAFLKNILDGTSYHPPEYSGTHVFLNRNARPEDITFLHDYATDYVIDPFVASCFLEWLGYSLIRDDAYICCTQAQAGTLLRNAPSVVVDDEVFGTLNMFIYFANMYGGAKHFRSWWTKLTGIPATRLIKTSTPTDIDYSILSPSQLQRFKQAYYTQVEQEVNNSHLYFRGLLRALFPFTQLGGSSRNQSLADVFTNLLEIRKKELQAYNKRLSQNSWDRITHLLSQFRTIEKQLTNIDSVLSEYKSLVTDNTDVEIQDEEVLKKLEESYHRVDRRRHRWIVKLGDVFNTLFSIYRAPGNV